MEDMVAIVSYDYDGERDDSVESNPDHYESVEKKPPLDLCESDDEEEDDDYVSSLDSSDCEYGPGGIKLSVEERKRIKKETNKKFEDWAATIKSEDRFAFFDTTGACILDADKRKVTNQSLLHDLACLLHTCRRRMTIYTFTHPGGDGHNEEGGGTIVHESSELDDLKLQSFSTKARKVIQQYNDTVTNVHSNSKLEFVSFIRSVYRFPNSLFITFVARQNGNGQIGTYQAALFDDFFGIEV